MAGYNPIVYVVVHISLEIAQYMSALKCHGLVEIPHPTTIPVGMDLTIEFLSSILKFGDGCIQKNNTITKLNLL
jgi:hypothetical protein